MPQTVFDGNPLDLANDCRPDTTPSNLGHDVACSKFRPFEHEGANTRGGAIDVRDQTNLVVMVRLQLAKRVLGDS